MNADVILNDQSLELHGFVIAKGQGISSDGKDAGMAFENRDNPGEFYTWYSNGEHAHLFNNGDILNIDRNGSFVCINHELTTHGPLSGFSFHDRGDDSKRFVWYSTEGNAHLFRDDVGDILTITGNTITIKKAVVESLQTESITINSKQLISTQPFDPNNPVFIQAGPLVIKYVTDGGHGTKVNTQMDLLRTILELKNRVTALEKKP